MSEKQQNKKLFYKNQQTPKKNHTKPAKFQDFVKHANFFYSTIGIQPYKDLQQQTKFKSFLNNFIFYINIINLNIVSSGFIVYIIKALSNGENFLEVTYAMSYFGFVSVSNCKMLFVWWRKSTLTKFVNGLKNIFPDQPNLQKDYNLAKYLKQCNFITLTFSWLYMILIWIYNLMAIFKYMVGHILLGMEDIEQDLPYMTVIPWNWKHHWSYYFLYFAQTFTGYTSSAGQISGDLFLVSCVIQIIMQFNYLSKRITNFTSSKNKSKDMKFLQGCIAFHDDLLDLCEQLNYVFGIPLLLNFWSSAFVICFVGFQITIGASPEIMFRLSLFFVCAIAQVYLICHLGQELLDVSSNVTSAVYNQQWYWADVHYQRMLVLMALRAQKSAQLKAPAFIYVSLDAMSKLMQLSYKYFALLRTMYSTK